MKKSSATQLKLIHPAEDTVADAAAESTCRTSGLDETLNLRPLASLPNLTRLWIGRGTLNERAFADASKIDSLQTLCLFSCRFDGEHLRHLQRSRNLATLSLQNIHAEIEQASYIMDESGGLQPFGEPTFRFEPSDDGWWDQPKTFPTDATNSG